MVKHMLSGLVAGMAAIAAAISLMVPAGAAELPVRGARSHHAVAWCGPCGCLRVSYVYHREILTTYGTGFDPRNYDQTRPHFYLGAVRRYPRYWVEAAWYSGESRKPFCRGPAWSSE
jgi:hypothetical protein